MTDRVKFKVLPAIIAILALADGVIHFLLDYVLFRGNLLGGGFPAGPRPGAGTGRAVPPPRGPAIRLPLPLNQLFVLNLIGEIVLVLLFLSSGRLLGRRRWLVNVAMIVYAGTTFAAWVAFGRPNPMNLGYLSKGIEIVLISALLLHIWSILRTPRTVAQE